MRRELKEMSSATVWTMSVELPSCITSPFTERVSSRSWGSGTSSAVTR